jgi:hypothetical protein
LPKDLFRAHILFELDEEAVLTYQGMERKVALHGVKLFASQEALAERGHSEIDEGMF